jgi:hypothetical protein
MQGTYNGIQYVGDGSSTCTKPVCQIKIPQVESKLHQGDENLIFKAYICHTPSCIVVQGLKSLQYSDYDFEDVIWK